MSQFKRILIFILMALIALSPAYALAETVIVVKSARAYAEPDASSRSVEVPAGTLLTLVAQKGGVSRVRRGEVTAYMDSSALEEVVEYGGETVYLKEDCAIRRAASQSAKSQKALNAGEGVALLATVADWAYVRSGSVKGFVPVSSLTTQAPEKDNSAEAVRTVTAYVANDGAKVYRSYSTDSEVLSTLSLNAAVEVSRVKNGWCQVVFQKAVAYMRRADLAQEPVSSVPPDEEALPRVTGYAALDGAKIYASRSTEARALATLRFNEPVEVYQVKDSWCIVKYGDIAGYMLKRTLSTEKGSEEEAPPVRTVTAYVQKDGAKAYAAPSTDGEARTSFSRNAAVEVSAVKGQWCAVASDGETLYMRKSDLATRPVSVTAYVKNEGARAYKTLSQSGGFVELPLNTELTVTASNGSWAQVKRGGTTAYMRLNDLSSEKTQLTSIPAYVKTAGAKVYEAPSASAKVLTEGTINDQVTVVLVRDGWATISLNGQYAYMLSSDLSDAPVAVEQAALQFGDKGEAVEKLQRRLKELGYFAGTVGGNYLQLTQAAVATFQKAVKISATGIADAQTIAQLFRDDAPQHTPASPGGSSEAGYSSAVPATGTAKEMDWWDSDIQKIFSRNTVAKVTDVATGISWYVIRKGGTNHADVQPLTAQDTNSMKKACGGKWSWQRRAIFVTIDGVNYAASMNCMPHGSGSIKDNNFDGHHCIHFTNSRTHGGNRVCPQHQSAIKKALAAKL